MPECIWKFRVKDLGPLTVAIDSHGGNSTRKFNMRPEKKWNDFWRNSRALTPRVNSKLDNTRIQCRLPTKLSARAAQNASTFHSAESLPLRFPLLVRYDLKKAKSLSANLPSARSSRIALALPRAFAAAE